MANMYFIYGQNIYIRPGAEVLGTRILEYIFYSYSQLMGHVLVLILNVLRFYEYITNTSEYFLNICCA